MIDFTKPYTATWRLYKVARDTWAEDGIIPGLTSLMITRDSLGDCPEIESGTMNIDMRPGSAFDPGYYRVFMVAEQDGYAERFGIGTFLCESSGGSVDHSIDDREVLCRSVLYPASVAIMEIGAYAPAGVNGAEYAAATLASAIHAPIEVSGSFTLDSHYVFDNGTTVLAAAWKILNAGNFCAMISGTGTVRIQPMPSEPVLILSRSNARMLMPSVSHEMDISNVPNVYRVVDGNVTVSAVNDDPASASSIVSRGYSHVTLDESPAKVDGETLQAYADRRLSELSTVNDERVYTREWAEGVHPFSLVRGSASEFLSEGDMRVISQEIICEHGVTVKEKASREVVLWRR